MRISDWSSYVCSSDLRGGAPASTRVIGTPRPLVATVATGAPLSTATKGAALSVMTTGKPGIMLALRCWTGVAAAADLQSDSARQWCDQSPCLAGLRRFRIRPNPACELGRASCRVKVDKDG